MPREKPVCADKSVSTEGLRRFLRVLKEEENTIIKQYMKDRQQQPHRVNRPPIQA